MKIKLLVVVVFILIGLKNPYAFKLDSAPSESIIPIRAIEQEPNGVTVSYEFPGGVIIEDDLYPETKCIEIPGFGVNSTPGEPAWPFRIDSFEIPDGYEPELSIISSEWRSLDIVLSPARPLLIDSSDEKYSLNNVPPIIPHVEQIPQNPVNISSIQTYRDRNILYTIVIPIKCNGNNETFACDKLSYRINFKESKNQKLRQNDIVRHEIDEEFMRSLFTSTLTDSSQLSKSKNNEGPSWRNAPYYLILSIPEYRNAIADFMDWKKCMGFNIDVIYSKSWNSNNIKETITKIYNKTGRLDYVLLIGDAITVPPVRHMEDSESEFEHSSDYTYGCMDGDDDMEQDIIIGRLNVSNVSEATNAINKIINYEKNPPKNNNFYQNALHAAFFQESYRKNYEDRRFVKTSEDIRNGLISDGYSIKRIYYANSDVTPMHWNLGRYSYGEAIPEDLLKPAYSWTGSTEDVVEAINSGVFYALHRGHGSYNAWGVPSISIGSLSKLNNKNLLPVFFQIHCQSGAFGHTQVISNPNKKQYIEIEKSFTEELQRMPSGGAVGIIAASEISYSGPNDVLAMEMFQSIWPELSIATKFQKYTPSEDAGSSMPMYSIGKILKKGISELSSKYTGSYIPYTKRIFHCFGDPSMEIYTEQPHIIDVFGIADNPYASRTNEIVNMSLVLKDGTVRIMRGKEFDYSYYKDNIAVISYYGHNIIPSIRQVNADSKYNESQESKIKDVTLSANEMYITFDLASDDTTFVRVRSINNLNCGKVEYPVKESSLTISTNNLEKALYVVELVENGIIVDYKKIII